MADSDPLSQMFNLFAAPLAGAVQSFDQFRNGVDQFQRGVENFNRTMENLNETAERMNVLLAEVEEPLRAAVPQVTRTVKTADEMMKVVSGPAMAVAPGLQVLAETLNNPALKQMPNQMAQMNEVLAEVTARLAPLGQLAESAGGLFGGLRLPGFGASPRPTPAVLDIEPDDDELDENELDENELDDDELDENELDDDELDELDEEDEPDDEDEPATIRVTRKTTAARKAPARKQTAAKKSAAKKAAEKKPAAARKKAGAKKPAAKKPAAKKSGAKKSTAARR